LDLEMSCVDRKYCLAVQILVGYFYKGYSLLSVLLELSGL